MNLRHFCVCTLIGAAATASFAQPNRIPSRIDSARTFALPGRVHPLATAANDQGEVESSFALPRVTLMLHPSAAQQAKLQQLLQDQQNPKSPSYHQWLTPEQYADQFGVSASDTAQIVTWLQGQGFTVDPVSRSRTFISFSASAGQVRSTFGTAIHRYKVNGQMHYANAGDLTIPAALSPLVASVRGLNDFRPKPRVVVRPNPQWNNPPAGSAFGIVHALAPDDFATVYDITPAYSAGINGTGQKIAIVGQSAITTSDITHFWSTFGISSTLVTKTVPRETPSISQGDVDESTLDIEWAGAVARNATIVFVTSINVWDSALYAVDNDVAPVLSMSYGECELYDLVDLPTFHQTVQQANAEGITWLAASGDLGAADCDIGSSVASGGLSVDEPGSIPEVTAMGGTALSGSSSYWSSQNSVTFASAKGYMPEIVWNETAASLAQQTGFAASGGGASTYFSQPSWQTSGGVPNDGWRHVPDLAFNSSEFIAPYYVYCSACSNSYQNVEFVGGTSAATPTMAGVVAMLNQYLKTNGLGNINPTIYNLYKTAPAAFHTDITGNNMVPCAAGSPGCVNGQQGYATGTGYNSAVGLGSVDVNALIQSWSSAAPPGPVFTISLDQNPVYQGATSEGCGSSSTWNFQITLAEQAGIAASVTGFTVNGTDYSSKIASIFGTSTIGARQSISGCMSLSGVSAPTYEAIILSGPNWSSTVNLSFQGPQATLNIAGATNAASYAQAYAPGMLMAVFGTGFGSMAEAAATVPLPQFMGAISAVMCPSQCLSDFSNSYPVPLWYVGPNQLNVQIPYELSGAVDLNVGNPYANADFYFTVSATAPGIFTYSNGDITPFPTASAGQVAFLYLTGQGRVSPSVADGDTPAAGTPLGSLPKPRQAVTVTVGGIAVSTTDGNWFVGIPSGIVGSTQINFTIPSNVPKGRQPVIVTVGTTSTPPAYITIQ